MHPAIVTPIIPKNTDVHKLCLNSKPDPNPNANGTTPKIKAKDVIAIGLSLFLEAWETALTSSSPRSSRCFANSTISRDFVKITTWILNCLLYNDSTRSEYFNFFETPYPHNETHTNT